jgi:cellulose 1,4-beta-cellobiosidase
MSYNGVIQPGQSTTFGFVANVSNGIVPSPKLTCTAS